MTPEETNVPKRKLPQPGPSGDLPGSMTRLRERGPFQFNVPGVRAALFDLEVIWDETAARAVCIVTERADNPGASVTNAARALFNAVCAAYTLDPRCTVWIEHYPARVPADYDLVTFPGNGGEPSWRDMTAEDWGELGLETTDCD
jgi:hypothetical protein